MRRTIILLLLLSSLTFAAKGSQGVMYFHGWLTSYYSSSNYYVSQIHITNLSSDTLEIEFDVYNYDGALITQDSRIFTQYVHPEWDISGTTSTAVFKLPPKNTAFLQIKGHIPSNETGYGTIKWKSNSDVRNPLAASGWIYRNLSSTEAFYSIPFGREIFR